MKAGFIMPHPPIIIPEIGMGREAKATHTIQGCVSVAEKIHEIGPKLLIVITPHGPVFNDAVCINMLKELKGSFANFNAARVQLGFRNNLVLARKIMEEIEKAGVACVPNNGRYQDELDHGALVPLYFIHQKTKDFELIHITIGMMGSMELYAAGKALKHAVAQEHDDFCVIASADLSHRLTFDAPAGYDEKGMIYDAFVKDCIENDRRKEFLECPEDIRSHAGECGHRPIAMLLGCLDDEETQNTILSYEGPFGVGYMNAVLEVQKNNENDYLRLAREAIETYVKTNKVMNVPKGLEKTLYEGRSGVFVSIKKRGSLRGCIGTITPSMENIASEIITNAIQAAAEDPRFEPVKEYELMELDLSVDILHEAEEISDIGQLNPEKYGVIVSKGPRRGLLLPSIEGVDTVKRQLEIALYKAGISPEESYTIQRFEVVRHK
ncbi:MAG: AmmeMemoRadiSam system protein A [Clostridia bacterium]